MSIFNRWKTRDRETVPRDQRVYDEALREYGQHKGEPVEIDVERFDRALAGLAKERTIIPNGLTVEEICNFMDHDSKGK